jgi:hypothetical protein
MDPDADRRPDHTKKKWLLRAARLGDAGAGILCNSGAHFGVMPVPTRYYRELDRFTSR